MFITGINEKAQDEAAKVFAQLQKTFEDIFSKCFIACKFVSRISLNILIYSSEHHDDEDEDSTESSIVKRDIFDFFGGKFEIIVFVYYVKVSKLNSFSFPQKSTKRFKTKLENSSTNSTSQAQSQAQSQLQSQLKMMMKSKL